MRYEEWSSALPTNAGDHEEHAADDRDPAEQCGKRVLLLDGAMNGAEVDGSFRVQGHALDEHEDAQASKQGSSDKPESVSPA